MVDLHIHSVLSPCGSFDMSPSAIVKRAKELNLSAIALTDHNSILNAPYVAKLSLEAGIKFFYGLEVQTVEEVHVLALFGNYENAEGFYDRVYDALPSIKNNPDYFGDQVVVDCEDNVIGFEEKLLLQSSQLSVSELVKMAEKFEGILIPAHVESETFGLLPHLGFVPEELKGYPMEISYNLKEDEACEIFPELRNYALFSFSDAHYLEDIGRAVTVFEVEEITLSSILEASREGSFYILRRQ